MPQIQILPEATGGFTGLTQALGQAAGALGGNEYQFQRERSRLNDALQNLDQVAKNPNASEFEILKSVLQATQGVKGAERFVGPVFETLMKRRTIKNTPPVSSIPKGTFSNNLPGFGPESTQNKPENLVDVLQNATPPISNENIPQPEGTPKLNPLNNNVYENKIGKYLPLDMKGLITPDVKAEALDKVYADGGDVNFARQQIDDYNAGKIQFSELINKNIDMKSAQIERQRKQEDDLRAFIDTQLPPNTSENEKNITYNLVKKESLKSEDLTTAYQNVAKKLDTFRKHRDKLISSIPPQLKDWGFTKEDEKFKRESAKPLFEIDPLAFSVIEEGYKQKGYSIITPHRTYRPLPSNLENYLGKSKDYNETYYPKISWFNTSNDVEFAQKTLNNVEMAEKQQKEETPKIIKEIEKNWSQDLSLINVYADLKAKGWFPNQIKSLILELEKKVRFSEDQYRQQEEISSNPRLPLNEVFSGLPESLSMRKK